MRQIQPDLWETDVEQPAPGLTTHAYLFIRPSGNVLFYNTGHRHEIEAMAELGGVAYQYLSHRDELGETITVLRERFGTRLGGHRHEQSDFARIQAPDIVFDTREVHLDAIEVIPTPGHSPGSTSFLVRSSHGPYLFTGDTIYRSDGGGWRAGMLPGISEPRALLESLRVLRELEPQLALSSAFGGEAGFERLTPERWRARVDEAGAALRARLGEST